ncbi:hypothetical protein [Defluviicoccus vanus]|uniref:hypothetical protein n=1 Tax=Defluviicoccus vanus TaxID=111831 RepID=UPI001CBA5E2A|nr:hypothetical protein [Defluviicoccus vanus]
MSKRAVCGGRPLFLEDALMKQRSGKFAVGCSFALCAMLLLVVPARAADDPLASWNEGPAKQAILSFVAATTDKASPKLAWPVCGRPPGCKG